MEKICEKIFRAVKGPWRDSKYTPLIHPLFWFLALRIINKSMSYTFEHSFTPSKQKKYLECIRKGMRICAAAKAVKVSVSTIWAYRKQHPEFEALIEQAEIEACEPVENALLLRAIEGHFPAMVFWLVNRSAGRWSDIRRVDFRGVNLASDNGESEHMKEILERLKKRDARNESERTA